MRALWLFPALVAAALAADLSGTWTGQIDVPDTSSGTTISTPVRLEVSQRGDAISGRIGRRTDQQGEPIRNGRVQGNAVSFEVMSPETTGAMRFQLKIDNDRLEGEMRGKVDSAGEIVGKVSLRKNN